MPKMDLRQNYRYTDGTLYRAGKGVDVPDHVAAWMRGPVQAPSPAPPDAPPQTGGPQEGLPDGYPYAEILSGGGFKSLDAVQAAGDEELLALDGIGPARLRELRAFEPV